MIISHNDHKLYYTSVTDEYRTDEWVSEEQKQKAISTDECWRVQWYPKTPIGFHMACGADLDVVLAAIKDK